MGVIDERADQILVTPAELTRLIAEHERHAVVLALAVAHVNDRGDWADHGAITMRAWMRDQLRMSGAACAVSGASSPRSARTCSRGHGRYRVARQR